MRVEPLAVIDPSAWCLKNSWENTAMKATTLTTLKKSANLTLSSRPFPGITTEQIQAKRSPCDMRTRSN
jgi:hypothetical protein